MAFLIENDLVAKRWPILVLNGGSSSIKFSVYESAEALTLLYDGEASGIGTPEARFDFHAIKHGERQQKISGHTSQELGSFRDAVRKIAATLDQPGVPRPGAIGHRVVHSGPKLTAHQRITPEVLADIEQATSFAPLHEPIALEIIHQAMHHFPGIENYACFDTIFHQSMPKVASTYPLPKEIREQGVRRYGFHGLSCESILRQFEDGRVPNLSPSAKVPGRLIIAHLGSGASVTAVRDGKSSDNTMGLTPCGGVLMGTRPGDLDPGLIFYLLRMQVARATNPTDAIEQMLNKRSGMLALSGLSNDMRILRDAAADGNLQAGLAIEAFVLSAKKAIGGFIALMGGVDAIVFTGGIGEHDALTRSQICAGLDAFGITIDPKKNEATQPKARLIGEQEPSTALYVLPAEEDRGIAAHVANMLHAH
ncbi:MAG: acetate/propionate family kinase [Acidobacteriaceae bacterium]